jgi:glycosyltransferase involved in cell wall biosynthesis
MAIPISVFIPVYNDSRWLPGAIESVLAQSHQDWELVVGDNASTEDLEPIVRRYGDERIRYHRWDAHVGIEENFNRTAALTTNPWVQLLCADDRIRPPCMERMAEVIEQWPAGGDRLSMVLTACRRVNERGESADEIWYGSKPKIRVDGGVYDAAQWYQIHMTDGHPPWNVGSVLIAQSVLNESGGFFRPEVGLSSDVELSLRAAAYGKVAYIDEPLLDFMVRSDADSSIRLWQNRSSADDRTPIEAALIPAMDVHRHRRGLSGRERRQAHAAIARSHLQRAGQHRVLPDGRGRRAAWADVLAAARWSPTTFVHPYHLAYGLAALIAPRSVLEVAKRRLVSRHR